MYEAVNSGRNKINYLLTGDSSPFYIWSGTPDTLPYLSVYKSNNEKQNLINYSLEGFSATSPFNVIFNGRGNLINNQSSISGEYNLIDGIDNTLSNSRKNLIIGSGNTIVGYGSNGFGLIHGVDNTIENPNLITNSVILSSSGSSINFGKYNTFLSSSNSYLTTSPLSTIQYGFVAGNNNSLVNNGTLYTMNYSFIGNGNNNQIISPTTSSSLKFNAIINGENNLITSDAASINNVVLFGSNLTAVSKNYSHFENLFVSETLIVSSNTISPTVSTSSITIDTNYSFHYINGDADASNVELAILIPTPTVDMQILSISISKIAGSNLSNIYFVDEVGGFASRITTTPTQIAAKDGDMDIGGNRMITHLNVGEYTAYLFMWTGEIDKWVMFISDTAGYF